MGESEAAQQPAKSRASRPAKAASSSMDPGEATRCCQIAFITDFTRLVRDGEGLRASGIGPLRWLWHTLTSGAVWKEHDLRHQLVLPWSGSSLQIGDFCSRSAWKEYLEDPEAAWARRFHADGEALFPRWWRKVLAADLVIGFELSPAIRRALHRRGCRYISFHIHPLRFLRDLCLGAVSNDSNFIKSLELMTVPDCEVVYQVHRFRAMCGFHRLSALQVPDGLPFLIGQTPRDSVLIRDDGTFAEWPDFEEELQTQLSDFDACILLEHPYRSDSRDIGEYLRCRLGKSVISTKTSGYGLLFSRPHIPKVITLASSLGVEAAAAGFPVSFLLGDPRQLLVLPALEEGSTLPLGHGVLSDSVWRAILGRGGKRRHANALDHPAWLLGDHYLRDSLDSWGYQALRDRLAGVRASTRWAPSVRMSEDRADELLEQLHPQPQWIGEVELKMSMPPIKLGQSISLSAKDPAFADLFGLGFYAVEDWGVWASPGTSEMVVPVEPREGVVLEVEIEVSCFEAVLPQCPVLEISHEEDVLGVVMFRPVALRAVQIKLACKADYAPVRLKFRVTDGASPKDIGQGTDQRRLAFSVSEVRLRLAKRRTDKGFGAAVWGLPGEDGRPSSKPMRLLLGNAS